MSNPFGIPEPAERREWFEVRRNETKPDEPTSAEVMIYDAIGGWWGIPASDFVKQLSKLDVQQINLRINSPGGAVSDATAIMNALKRHPANITATVDGLAASSASWVVTAADEVVMGTGSQMMIHDVWSGMIGNAADMRKEADIIDGMSQTTAEIYAKKAGGTADEWRAAMLAETWYSAQEAVDAGLADRLSDEAATNAENSFDLSRFAYAGRDHAPAPFMPNRDNNVRGATRVEDALLTEREQPGAQNSDPTSNERKAQVPTLNEGLRERLGVSADVELDDDALLARVDEALNARPTQFTPPEGVAMIDSAQLADLRSAAEDGRAARNEQIATHRAALVENAINEGRIPVARRDHWLAQLNADEEGATEVLNSLEPNTIPLAPLGFTGGVDEHSDEAKKEDAAFKKLAPQMGIEVSE